MLAQKYVITAVCGTETSSIKRFGYGVAAEEAQKLLNDGIDCVRVRIDGTNGEIVFSQQKQWKLTDLKMRIRGLSVIQD